MKGSAKVIINKAIEEVYTFITDVRNNDKWVEGASDTHLTSEGEIRVGSVFEGKYTYSGKTHDISYEVVTMSPPNQFGVKSLTGPFPFENWLDLKDMSGKTEISNTIEAGSDHFITTLMFIFLKPILRRQMNKQMEKELINLKKLIEAT
jgi:hypothetical protein